MGYRGFMEAPRELTALMNRYVPTRVRARITPLLERLGISEQPAAPADSAPPHARVAPPAAGERLWLDWPSFETLVNERTEDLFLRHHARNLSRDGFTHIPGSMPLALCDEVVADFHRYCEKHSDQSAKFADQYGQHSRLCNFHLASPPALKIALDENVMRLLDFLFGRRSAVFSSLVFEKGSQQAIHRDGPYFRTEPAGFFFGVWTALEDVAEAAGPLVYLRGGHRVEVTPDQVRRRHEAEKPKEDLGVFYNRIVAETCDARGLKPESPFMRKGDTLIWHPDLPHGGKPILDRMKTRKSIVVHYGPEGTPIYGPDVFFGGKPSGVQMPTRYRGDRAYSDQGSPVFHENH